MLYTVLYTNKIQIFFYLKEDHIWYGFKIVDEIEVLAGFHPCAMYNEHTNLF